MPRNLLAAIFLMLCFGLPTFSQALESKSGHAQEVASYGHLEKFILAEATLSFFKDLVTVGNSFRGIFRGALM